MFEAIAGESWRGSSETWSESITIDSTGAYQIDFGGCVGPNDAIGQAEFDGSIIRVNDVRRGVTGDGVLKDLVVVRWGERTYLVRADKGIDFCNALNDGREPRDGKLDSYAFLLNGDWRKPVGGLPSVPEERTGFLPAAPLEGEVVEWEGNAVWIDLGADDGLVPDLELFTLDVPTAVLAVRAGERTTEDAPLTIVSIERERTLVAFRYQAARRPAVPVGTRVSTAGRRP